MSILHSPFLNRRIIQMTLYDNVTLCVSSVRALCALSKKNDPLIFLRGSTARLPFGVRVP